MTAILDDAALAAALADLPGWTFDAARQGIARDFAFPDFAQAFAFMTRVAAIAEAMDHHPDWSNCWNRVAILLTTHDAGGVTALDIAMARRIDAVLTSPGTAITA
ncbi:MAG TPA: 4a-hydroxytetrahydrobiopterin dehydratase [Allosphingosinicella sp.]